MIAQGTEGGGHTGDVASTVLWPEVIDAVAPTPVLAAGGIGNGRQVAAALAMGAQGVWTGTLWLTVEEADIPPGQMDTYLGADVTRHGAVAIVDRQAVPHDPQRVDRGVGAGRHARPARHAAAVHGDRQRRVGAGHRYPEQAKAVNFNPAGQVIGQADRGAVGEGRHVLAGRGVHRGDGAAPALDGGLVIRVTNT